MNQLRYSHKCNCLLFLFLAIAFFMGTFTPRAEAGSEGIMIFKGQKLNDSGEYDESVRLLSKAVETYPSNDAILSLLGEALFLRGDFDLAEDKFRKALNLNLQNEIAKKYIERIREINDAKESQGWATFINVFWDKVGDFIVFLIAVFLGTFLTAMVEDWRRDLKKVSESVKAFSFSNTHDDNDEIFFRFFAEIEEMMLKQQKLAAVRDLEAFYVKFRKGLNALDEKRRNEFLVYFLQRENVEVSETFFELIENYVDDVGVEKAILKIFTRMVRQEGSIQAYKKLTESKLSSLK